MIKNISFLLIMLLCSVACAEQRPHKFGHYQYEQAEESLLVPAGQYRVTGRIVKMRKEAAAAFQKMTKAAEKEKVYIVPISGFRTYDYQKRLFNRAVKRYGSEKKAAKWVAPHGHSEHHTGWTLDVGDKANPKTDVETEFEDTDAFQWMAQNAADFGFELSFPKNNEQGVSYEPWHWRYVGTKEAQKLFNP